MMGCCITKDPTLASTCVCTTGTCCIPDERRQAVSLVSFCCGQVPACCVVLYVVHDHMVQAISTRGHSIQRGQEVGRDSVEPAWGLQQMQQMQRNKGQ
jgi:hypothetical protein